MVSDNVHLVANWTQLIMIAISQCDSDYMELSTILNFTNASLLQNVSLNITDDNLLELTEEDFGITLSLMTPEDKGHVFLMPDSATIIIVDNDSEK